LVSDLCELLYKHSKCKNPLDFGVIAPYNVQVNAIKSKFSKRKFFQDIEVSTFDQFQGRDKRVIIMSFTNTKTNEDVKVIF
jgi:superfamily I DNA and/or RNA helicase